MKATGTTIALVLAYAFTLHAQQPGMTLEQPKITVNGDAVINVQPDNIVITFGIETWDVDMMDAKKQNNDILKKAITEIKEFGVAEKDIQTDHLSMEPRYRDDYTKDDFLGCFVRNTFVVTLKEAGNVEALVTKVLKAGVKHVHGIDFQTTELRKHRDKARELALLAAKEKAASMAAVLGLTIGMPLQISENYSGSPWRYYSSWYGGGYGGGGSMSQNVSQNVDGPSGGVSDTVALGKISIRAGVSVTFELKP